MSSCKSVLTSLREAIDAKLPADQRCPKTIAQMTEAVNGIKVGGAKYYKCRAVHAGNKTWDGYEVTFDDRGISAISDTLTTGLTYGAIAPLRQNIYSADGVQQVRGAMMSGNLPTPLYYVSGETPGGNIYAQEMSCSGDGDNKNIYINGGYQYKGYDNYVDGVYKPLPGFPESASDHDWAYSIVGHDLRCIVLVVGGAGAGSGRALRIDVGSNWISFDGDHNTNGTTIQFTPLFTLQSGVWRHFVVSYAANERKYTMYINGIVWAEITEENAIDRPFDRFMWQGNGSKCFIYLFAEQINANQAKLLAKQHWIFEGLELSGLDDVYNSMWGSNVSPNGKLKEYGTYMNKPRYYVTDEYDMSLCNIQWNGTQWEIYVDEYDPETWEPVKKILATGEGGNDPSEAEWTDTGYGLPTVTAKYANGI